jgi:hypothetical protein
MQLAACLGQEKGHLEELGVGGNNIKINLEDMVCQCIDWIHLAQVKDTWCVLVSMVLNLLSSIKCQEFPGLLASEEGLCFSMLVS